jgi:hypothetical protein
LISLTKYILFFCSALFGIPIAFILAKHYKYIENILFFLFIFLTCQMIDINLISREAFRITSRGFEFGLVDIFAIIFFKLILDRKASHPIKKLPPGSILYFLYFFFSLLSIFNSDSLLFSSFEVFKMVKMYFFYWVIYNYINSKKQLKFLTNCISITILYIFTHVIVEKYILGHYQVTGPLPHQNSLVMYLLPFVSIVFAYLLENSPDIKILPSQLFNILQIIRHYIYWLLALLTGIISIFFTLSRGGIAAFAISFIIIMFLSLTSRFSAKKLSIFFLIFILGSGITLRAADTIINRFKTAPIESGNVRIQLAKAAINMANDNPFGIGLNNFGIKINYPYDYGQHIIHRNKLPEDAKNGLVETIYLMIAAETGWINLGFFLLWIGSMYYTNIRNFFRYKKSNYRYLTIGLAGGLSAIYIESTLEWVLKQSNNFYQLMLIFAVISIMTKLYKINNTIQT